MARPGAPPRRRDLRARGAALRRKLGLRGSPLGAATGLDDLLDEMVHASVWGRPALGVSDRMVCTLAAVTVAGRGGEIQAWTEAALEVGLEAPAIAEVFLQCGLYAGFGATEQALACAGPVFAEAGVAWPDRPEDDESLDALDAAAQAFAADLHGERSDTGYADPQAVTGELYAIVRRYGYGAIWRRPALSRRQRLLCALAGFAALGLEPNLRKFAASALAGGLDAAEVREAILQTAPYAGFPRALAALGALADLEKS